MSKIIILNGPANCGKDTIGENFSHRSGYEATCFKQPLFRIAANTMGMSVDDFRSCYEDREWKEEPKNELNGHSVRELMIQISETFIKPFFGEDYFSQALMKEIGNRPWAQGFVITDGGFVEEVEPLCAAGHEVILVHMYRDGCTFEGDARNYVLTNSVSHIHTLTNNGTVEEGIGELERILDEHNERNHPTNFDERELVSGDSESIGHMAQPVRRGRNGRGGVSPAIADVLRRAEAQARERLREGSAPAPRAAAYSWTTNVAPAAFYTDESTASSATVVDESEVMSEGEF